MKKILLSLASLCIACSLWAAGFNTVSVYMADGSQVDIALSTQVKLLFGETHLTVAGTDAEISLPKAEIVRFVHTDKSGLTDAPTAAEPQFDGSNIHFSALPHGSVIDVYNASGSQILSATAEGDYTLQLGQLAPAVYIVTVNGTSYKISIR